MATYENADGDSHTCRVAIDLFTGALKYLPAPPIPGSMRLCLTLTSTVWLACQGVLLYAETVSPDRLWLPPSAAHLMPALQEASRQALNHPECAQVLYGRLNEFRTEHEAPALTILCQRDARSTFNLVFRVDELRVSDTEENNLVYTTDNAASNLEALRRALLSRQELESTPDGDTGQPENDDETTAAGPDSSTTRQNNRRSLELDLDDLLRRPERQSDNPPELF